MSFHKEYTKVKSLSYDQQPSGNEWLHNAKEGIRFLRENALSDHVMIYASLPNVLIKSIFVPEDSVSPPDIDDLLKSNFYSDASWCIQRSFGGTDGHQIYLQPPLEHTGSKTLKGSEPIVIIRSFEGLKGFDAPIEMNQKLIHSLDVHFLEEFKAYCKLSQQGDIEQIIKIFNEAAIDSNYARAVLIKASELSEYLAVSKSVLFRRFDFTRFIPGDFDSWDNQKRSDYRAPDLFYNESQVIGNASYVNGGQIIRSETTVENMIEDWKRQIDPGSKRYETFLIQDFKNQRLTECSCNPEALGNYFIPSSKPFETSPVFFRSEVLAKYKADPAKYELGERSISCRSSWHLKTYDVNDANQVHTYIVYLSTLPYEEQQYWKSFNEEPKAPISQRALETDFFGRYPTDPEPLSSLKDSARKLDKAKFKWWKPRGTELSDRVLYPTSTSAKEWADELLALDQLLVEGFVPTELRRIAETLGAQPGKDWQSLKLIESILEVQGATAEESKQIVEPLRTLHHLRSKLKGHATGERIVLERKALSEHESFREHFRVLCTMCDRSMLQIMETLKGVSR